MSKFKTTARVRPIPNLTFRPQATPAIAGAGVRFLLQIAADEGDEFFRIS